MKDLNKLTYDCINELQTIGITPGNVVSIEPESRSKRRNGQCRKRGDIFKINISARLLNDNVREEDVKMTIIHELLHTLPGCFNHGKTWKSHANKVNKLLGYNVQVCNDIDGVERAKPKYAFACSSCGQKIGYHRKSKFTDNYWRYRCGVCGGNFEPVEGD